MAIGGSAMIPEDETAFNGFGGRVTVGDDDPIPIPNKKVHKSARERLKMVRIKEDRG